MNEALSDLPSLPAEAMPPIDVVPLVYTTKGNLPADSLMYSTKWVVDPEYIKFVEIYTLDGEVVRESAHVLTRTGIDPMAAHAQALN